MSSFNSLRASLVASHVLSKGALTVYTFSSASPDVSFRAFAQLVKVSVDNSVISVMMVSLIFVSFPFGDYYTKNSTAVSVVHRAGILLCALVQPSLERLHLAIFGNVGYPYELLQNHRLCMLRRV